jgi:hypothetical protein
VFLSDVRARIENFSKESVAQNIKSEWKRLTETDTPSVWANNNGIPARFALSNITEASDIIAAIQTPEKFSSDKLSDLLNVLSGLSHLTIVECQELFVAETVPHRFVKFNINLSSMLEFLRSKYGNQPNNWQIKPDISEYIRNQYKGTFAPQVTEKIEKTSADELKNKLLKLALDNPDLGLLFWE